MPPLSWGRMIPHILPPTYAAWILRLGLCGIGLGPLLPQRADPRPDVLACVAIPLDAGHSPADIRLVTLVALAVITKRQIPNILLAKKTPGQLIFLNRNARTVDAKFNTLRLGFLTVRINSKGNYRDYERADDEIKCVLFHGWAFGTARPEVRKSSTRWISGSELPGKGQDPAGRIICIHGRCGLLAAGPPGSPQSTPLEARAVPGARCSTNLS
jgi:hypothetical protein